MDKGQFASPRHTCTATVAANRNTTTGSRSNHQSRRAFNTQTYEILETRGTTRTGKARAKPAVDAAAAAGGRVARGDSVTVPRAHGIERHVAVVAGTGEEVGICLLYTSPSPRD